MTTSSGARLAPILMSIFTVAGVGLVGAGAAMATGDAAATTQDPTTAPPAAAEAAPTAAPTGSGSLGAGVCVEEYLEWSGSVLLASFSPLFDTGLVVPAAEPGGSVEILGANWVARNVYPEQNPGHTRANDNQLHESFALFVGDTQVGGLTPDLPDTVEEGAVTEWASGDQLGSFGAASVAGGPIVLKHSFLFGFDESANSLEPQLISIDLRRCGPPAPTTTLPPTTTVPPTTVAETTTTVEVIPPTTAAPTTAASIVATVATTTPGIPTTAPRVSTTQPILVATGRTSGWIIGAGGASLLSGMTLLRLRRRGLAR